MAISLNAPNPDNYVVGKGVVSMKLATDADYVLVGNVTEFEWTPELEELDHFSSQSGVKEIDKSVVLSKKATVRMVMEEWIPRNLSLMLMGDAVVNGNDATIDIMSANVTRCALKYEGKNEIGPQWNLEFPAVDFKPSSSLNVISEEWAPIEVTGTSVRTGGTFGTATSTFADTAPVNTVPPAITGTPAVGQMLTAFVGVWDGSAASYTYVWKKAAVAIPGATANTYVVQAGDAASAITVEVTATNGAGTDSAESAAVNIP
jgi:hypothetical protein